MLSFFLFYMNFILLFCFVAIWKAPSECLYFENLPLGFLFLQQVPQEPHWTRTGVTRSTSWQEPRSFLLLVVNKGRAHIPLLQAPVRWLLQRTGPALLQFPLALALLLAPCFSQLYSPESGEVRLPQEMWDRVKS